MSRWWKDPDSIVTGPEEAKFIIEADLFDAGLAGGKIRLTIHEAGNGRGSIMNCWFMGAENVWIRIPSGLALEHPPDFCDLQIRRPRYIEKIRELGLVQENRLVLTDGTLSIECLRLINRECTNK